MLNRTSGCDTYAGQILRSEWVICREFEFIVIRAFVRTIGNGFQRRVYGVVVCKCNALSTANACVRAVADVSVNEIDSCMIGDRADNDWLDGARAF